jgi:hypothetical protein
LVADRTLREQCGQQRVRSRNEGIGCDRAIYVNSSGGLQGFANVSNRAIVGDVNAFLPTAESDSSERNSDREVLLLAFVDGAEMITLIESIECGDERS